VDPNVVLFVFLRPLIYAASFGSSTQDLRVHAREIGLLAVGLMLVTMGAVALIAHAVADTGWGPALVLGAILGPTDPIAATSVLRRLGAPDRISTPVRNPGQTTTTEPTRGHPKAHSTTPPRDTSPQIARKFPQVIAGPPLISSVVQFDSGPLFAGMRRIEQWASTAGIDGRVPLRLGDEQLRGYCPG